MRFSSVAIATCRFLQCQAVFVFQTKLDPSQLEEAFQRLLMAWPDLRARVNLQWTGSCPSADTAGHWQSRVIDAPLRDCVSLDQMTEQELEPSEYARLEQLFRFGWSLRSLLFPPVLLADIAINPEGLYRILSAYTAILRGETIDPIVEEPRPNKIVFKPPKETSSALYTHEPLGSRLHESTTQHWASGWLGNIIFALWHWLVRATFAYKPRARRTMHIPGAAVDRLHDRAAQQGLAVTRHDLVMAIIAQAALQAYPHLHPAAIAFVYNFRRHLDQPAQLQNTSWLVSIPLPTRPNKPIMLDDSDDDEEEDDEDDRLLMLASCVRDAVRTVRTPECLELFRQAHTAMGPWRPFRPALRHPNHPNTLVSSSSQLPWYSLCFGGGPETRPFYASMAVGLIDLWGFIGLSVHDWILTSKDREDRGYFLYGSLHAEHWAQLRRGCARLVGG
ncbi:uncharacterized protein BO72DRAFT_423542 [Aspergillus fijiensis CBS 313.89]|uniref:Uncharacterized protein n=1 Tax=Aspergillus fijiensis CBS 313.89 TaxID=1448319 RepID=A0A8G1RYZ6_9EURO|nr:uncharacterized protein BO72DRAFT_423542 [Aspergillus fijiensis CBS 313.89]RAK80201.1 hypothetical protein BO72DRAFT_423542 [Aspergillus fijiensis CBS 313.89]